MAKSKTVKVPKTSETGWDMKFKVYEDSEGEHRWRLVASNGRIMATSAEGYDSKSNAERAIKSIAKELRKDNPGTLHDVLEVPAPAPAPAPVVEAPAA